MSTVSGAYGVGDPPVPIPNTVVKTHCGNNTWTTRSWQDSTVPDFSLVVPNPSDRKVGGVRRLKAKGRRQRRRKADADTSDYKEVASYTYPADAGHAAMAAALPPLG